MKEINYGGSNSPLVAIGGVGGSGTRLIADILKTLGFYIGNDLNESNDNLWFTLLFKHLDILSAPPSKFEELADIFFDLCVGKNTLSESQVKLLTYLASIDRPQHSSEWLDKRVKSLVLAHKSARLPERAGWKEPNTHIVIDRLQNHYPSLKYIHVMRNGLDMAYSENQNQLNLWGRHYLQREINPTPYDSLKFWVSVHTKLIKKWNEQILLLNFDKLCISPRDTISELLDFLNIDQDTQTIEQLTSLVITPKSIGRFKKHDLNDFDPIDIRFVETLGFDTNSHR